MLLRPSVFFLGLGLISSLPAQDSQSAKIPFPEEWDPYPLRFHYTEVESLYLPLPARLTPVKKSGSVITGKSYTLPDEARRWIRVLLQENAAGISLDSGNSMRMKMKRADGSISEGPALSGAVRIEVKGQEFRITATGRKAFSTGPVTAIRIIPKNPAMPLSVNGKTYRGDFEFGMGKDRGCRLLNVLGIEDYLRGVLPKEMGNRGVEAFEALKAQAVVARTYALKRMLAASLSEFDVYASVQDQVYGGAGVEYALSDSAVNKTRGLVLRHADTLALCYYYSTCGGITASRHEVWGGPVIPYLLSHPDRDDRDIPWCQASAYSQWTQSWPASTLAGIIRRNVNGGDFRTLKNFRILSRFACGRIQLLEVETDRGKIEIRGDKIRYALKPGIGEGRILESARFSLSIEANRILAKGSGFGHGIGLCQMGALGRAASGNGFVEILSAYYPGTETVPVR